MRSARVPAMIPPMRWCAPGYERPLEDLVAALRATPWPGPPPGYEQVTLPRPMRTVLRGVWTSPHGSQPVIVKWSRRAGLADVVSRALRGGKGVREGRVLRRLRRAGVPTPEPLAFVDGHVDVLVTAAVPGLRPAPAPDDAGRAQIRAVAALLACAHDVGMRHRDLHAANLGWSASGPVLVDLGGARIADPLDEEARITELARSVHGLLDGTRRSQRLRALVAYETAREAADVRGSARRLAGPIEAEARRIRRRYRRGRDRRARRTGKHFEQFATDGVARGVRFRDTTDAGWRERAAAWLADVPPDAVELKAGGSVVRVGEVVLKYHDAVAAGRLPRPVRAFRRAFALMNRGVAVPRPHLAAARADGSGVYAAAFVDAPDLLTAVAGGGVDAASLRCLGRALRAVHDAEVSHRDLKAPNVLVADDGTFPIVDLEGVRIRRRPVRWARRARDLMRLDASLDLPPALRRAVLAGYHDVLPRPPVGFEAFVARVGRLAARKRGPSGEPR